VAVAAVLTTTVGDTSEGSKKDDGGVSSVWLIVGALSAGLFKFGQTSLKTFSGAVHGIIDIGKFNIGGGEKSGIFYGGFAASPALLGVGWIIGPKIASFIFVGGLLGWVILAPLIALAVGLPSPTTPSAVTDALALGNGNFDVGSMIWGFYQIWGDYIRYVGVGAMVVGGLYTIFKLRANLAEGIKEAIAGIKGSYFYTLCGDIRHVGSFHSDVYLCNSLCICCKCDCRIHGGTFRVIK
jgi:uncharacterized oligopeptide transporter (OPT) family protein